MRLGETLSPKVCKTVHLDGLDIQKSLTRTRERIATRCSVYCLMLMVALVDASAGQFRNAAH